MLAPLGKSCVFHNSINQGMSERRLLGTSKCLPAQMWSLREDVCEDQEIRGDDKSILMDMPEEAPRQGQASGPKMWETMDAVCFYGMTDTWPLLKYQALK